MEVRESEMVSLYEQIKAYLLTMIRQEGLKANDKMPSERLLVERFSSTRITVREALSRLESEGIIYRQNRRGWFLAPERFIIDPARKVDFTRMAIDQMRLPQTRVCHIHKVRPLAAVRKMLALTNGAQVYEIRRIRSLDQRLVMMEDIYLSSEKFSSLAQMDLSGSITQLQREKFGVDISGEDCSIRVAALDNVQAEQLQANPGMPCLHIQRHRFDKLGDPVDFNIEYWLHNAVEMKVSVR